MTSAISQAKLWYWQRISAMVLALCVLGHLAVIIYAVRGGLSAAEILGRTQGNWLLGGFYGLFVLACAVHVPLGLTTIAAEWLGWRGRSADVAAALVSGLIAIMGWRAIYGLIA
ncbi:MAG: succinate dehydrogenase [Betaproteobacteria bacterium CG2_30_68_42]|nr:MAG: succinate dehydrogenase [Betaproteobacteria bacterium CG2_30_68_42]